MNDPTQLFARDGHVTMLSMDRYDAGEFDDDERRCLADHVEHCSACRGRWSAVSVPSLAILPPLRGRDDTGSVTLGYLATTAGVAMAASLVAGVGATLWPSPQLARETETEAVGVATAYTSVAQEYSQPDSPQLEVAWRDGRLLVRAEGDGSIAIVRVSEDEDEGGTGGLRRDEIVDVLLTAHAGSQTVAMDAPSAIHGSRIVAITCNEPAEFAAGDDVPDDGACRVRDVPTRGQLR